MFTDSRWKAAACQHDFSIFLCCNYFKVSLLAALFVPVGAGAFECSESTLTAGGGGGGGGGGVWME